MSPLPLRGSTRLGGVASASNCRWRCPANGRCPASILQCWPEPTCCAGSRFQWSADPIRERRRRADGGYRNRALSRSRHKNPRSAVLHAGAWQRGDRAHRDRQGRLVTCEMDAQRLTRTEYDGTVTVLADHFDGKRLTAPNDVVVKSDGSIWFSDNGAGTRGNYLGHTALWELPLRVYRLDPASGAMTVVVGDMERPNGLAFSPDEKLLYVIDTPGPGRRSIQVYDVVENGTGVANRRQFNAAEPGGSDGMRVDIRGNLWCAWSGGEAEDGVAVFAPDGDLIGRIMLPERCANLCFGGMKRNRLFMAASQSIYSLYVETQGTVGG